MNKQKFKYEHFNQLEQRKGNFKKKNENEKILGERERKN